MTIGVRSEITNSPGSNGSRAERRRRRIARLYASDPQFRAASPLPEVIDAARRPGLRLPEVIKTLVDGYADRPALGQRTRKMVLDRETGNITTQLLPSFETISYGDLWTRVRAVATALRRDKTFPVNPGDFVATVGFAGADYLTVDLVCSYLGLVSVPLQHSAPVSVLQPIIDEIEPRVLAAGAQYLDLAVESALQSRSLRHLVVFDFQPQIDEHRENLERAQQRNHPARSAPSVRADLHRRNRRQAGDDPVHVGQHRNTEGRNVHRTDVGQPVDDIDRARNPGIQRELYAVEPHRRAAATDLILLDRRHQLFRRRI
jgi:fatty acid CoA ligase FadD9